jgi:hypothetical protein
MKTAMANVQLVKKVMRNPLENWQRALVVSAALASMPYGFSVAAATLRVPADYPTIQAAVDAAAPAGDEILIAPGVYEQQVFITEKKLTLTGSPGTVIQAWTGMSYVPSGPSYNLVDIRTNADVVLRNIKFDGKRLAASMPNKSALLEAVLFFGASGRVENCIFNGFRGTNNLGSAVYAPLGGLAYGLVALNPVGVSSGVTHVKVLNCSFSDNGGSIFFAAIGGINPDPTLLRTTFVVEGNTISGIGPTTLDWQEGIRVHGGASGIIKNNRIIDHYYYSTAPWSFGMLAVPQPPYALHPLRIEGNTFSGNKAHVCLILADHSQVINNMFEGFGNTPDSRAVYLTGSDIRVALNRFTNVAYGIVLADENSLPRVMSNCGKAINPLVLANYFSCDVPTQREFAPLTTGLVELGTEICVSVTPGYGNLTCSPAAGLPGSAVLLSGTNLAGATTVLFNGLSAQFTPGADPDREILAIVPARATTGPVTVIRPPGNITSLNPFTVPVLLAMAPKGNQDVQLSWCADACDMLLECSSSLVTPVWQPVVTSPAVGAESVTWTCPVSSGSLFFRLRQP